jgi:hypothetical protein
MPAAVGVTILFAEKGHLILLILSLILIIADLLSIAAAEVLSAASKTVDWKVRA